MIELNFYYLVILFFIYSLLGWIMEVILKYIEYHRFINRGFLIGPYCPIYGTGAIIVTIVSNLINPFESSYGTSFLISFILCGGIEYFTSYFLEKKFHARWWDYSQKPMNLHGRVWIGNLILFGLGGMLVDKFSNPILFKYLNILDMKFIKYFSLFIIIVMGIDLIISQFIMNMLKEGVEKSNKDRSEEIAKEVKTLLGNKSLLHRRIIDAYPEITFRTEKVKERINMIKEETENFKKSISEKITNLSNSVNVKQNEVNTNLRNVQIIQEKIIDLQNLIIEKLSNGEIDENIKEELLSELEKQKELLKMKIKKK